MDLRLNDNDYHVTSVTKARVDGQEWYKYTISNKTRTSTITGQRRGTLKQVSQHAEEYSQQLNDRMKSNVGYYKSNYQKKK